MKIITFALMKDHPCSLGSMSLAPLKILNVYDYKNSVLISPLTARGSLLIVP